MLVERIIQQGLSSNKACHPERAPLRARDLDSRRRAEGAQPSYGDSIPCESLLSRFQNPGDETYSRREAIQLSSSVSETKYVLTATMRASRIHTRLPLLVTCRPAYLIHDVARMAGSQRFFELGSDYPD